MNRRALVGLAALVCLAGFLTAAGAGRAIAATPGAPSGSSAAPAATVPPVTHLTAPSVTDASVKLSWQWPSATSVTRVVIRMAKGSAAPASATAGTAAGTVTRPAHTLVVGHLAPYTSYAFAAFARNKSGDYAKRATLLVVTRPLPLKLGTRALPAGTRGLFYIVALSASGGVAPYAWTGSRLPPGLSLSRAGVISGYPRATGTSTVTLRVRDARGTSVTGKLRLAVPTSLPAACVAKSCAQLSRDTHTVQVPAADLVSVTRSPGTGKVTTVVLSGITVAVGDILVLPPASAIPSGLIVAANSVSTAGNPARETIAVTYANPAAAYYQGVVQTIVPAASVPSAAVVIPQRIAALTPDKRAAARRADGTTLKCDASVTAEVHGLTVRPALKASIGLDWKHNLFGGKGIYAGYGGLKIFQVGLTGTVTVDLGASISGKATCTLDLPEIHDPVPAGPLGVVLVTYSPSVTLTVTGGIAVDTSVTLDCYAGYEWDEGTSTRTDYCTASHQPLKLSSANGLDATLTGGIEVDAALDDLPGIKGSIDDSLHLGYHPQQTPAAELDAASDYELQATLADFWKGAPTVTIAHGEFFHVTLATWGGTPPGDTGSPAISVSPAQAWPWNPAVCGGNEPPNGSDTFAVSGTGFKPGEKVTIATGWETYPGTVTAAPGGTFSVTESVGEVPGVLNEPFAVDATGSAGSAAESSITLDSNGCAFPSEAADGTITLNWGGNGYDPGSGIDLYIDDTLQDSATTDSLGSGGSVTTFACPASGSYTWDVDGTVDGGPVTTNDLTQYCTPATAGSAVRQRAGHGPAAAAVAAAVPG